MADSRLNLSRAGSVIMGAKRNDDGGFLGQPMKELEQAEDDFAQQALVEAVENQIADGHPREAGLVIMDLIGQGRCPGEDGRCAGGADCAFHAGRPPL